MSVSVSLFLVLASQATTSSVTADALLQAVRSAERAAQAAQAAAEAAAKAAGVPVAAPATPAAPPEEKKPPSPWSGTVGFSFIWIAGNSEALTLTSNLAVERKTEQWILGFKADGAYGQSLTAASATGETEVVALNAQVQARGDWRFTHLLSAYAAAGLATDHVKSVELRGSPEGGIGLLWYEDKREDFVFTSLQTDLAFRYTKELRFQYFPVNKNLDDIDLFAPRLGVAFRYAASKDAVLTEDAEVLPNIIGDARVLVNSTTKLAVKLTEVLAFTTAFLVKYDSAPAEGKKPTDTSLTAGLQISL
ncbi:MAG: DUF481 domain-containing protein [Deltaproteobacteria bacterium]|nr:DUF481 domain-containing protein [Deltaproteobacteria bacterium]